MGSAMKVQVELFEEQDGRSRMNVFLLEEPEILHEGLHLLENKREFLKETFDLPLALSRR
jgi:hypothetical protein